MRSEAIVTRWARLHFCCLVCDVPADSSVPFRDGRGDPDDESPEARAASRAFAEQMRQAERDVAGYMAANGWSQVRGAWICYRCGAEAGAKARTCLAPKGPQ